MDLLGSIYFEFEFEFFNFYYYLKKLFHSSQIFLVKLPFQLRCVTYLLVFIVLICFILYLKKEHLYIVLLNSILFLTFLYLNCKVNKYSYYIESVL